MYDVLRGTVIRFRSLIHGIVHARHDPSKITAFATRLSLRTSGGAMAMQTFLWQRVSSWRVIMICNDPVRRMDVCPCPTPRCAVPHRAASYTVSAPVESTSSPVNHKL